MNNKSKVNPFKFVNGKIITVHQSTGKIGDLEQARQRAVELGQRENVERLDKQIATEGKYLNENKPKNEKSTEQAKEETKVKEEVKSPTIPDFSQYDFNTAFGKGKQMAEKGIGQFTWNGNLYGTALNTKEDLGNYDTKYKSNFNSQYTGSGIGGETYQSRENNRIAQERGVKGQTPQNPSSGVKPKLIYDGYTGEWKPEVDYSNYAGDNATVNDTPKSIVNPFSNVKKQESQFKNVNTNDYIKQDSNPIFSLMFDDENNERVSSEVVDTKWIKEKEGVIFTDSRGYDYRILRPTNPNEKQSKYNFEYVEKKKTLDQDKSDIFNNIDVKELTNFNNKYPNPKTYFPENISIEEKISKGRIEGNWKKHLNTEDVKMLKLRGSLQKNRDNYNSQFPFLTHLEFKELQSYKAQGGIINPFIPKAQSGMLLEQEPVKQSYETEIEGVASEYSPIFNFNSNVNPFTSNGFNKTQGKDVDLLPQMNLGSSDRFAEFPEKSFENTGQGFKRDIKGNVIDPRKPKSPFDLQNSQSGFNPFDYGKTPKITQDVNTTQGDLSYRTGQDKNAIGFSPNPEKAPEKNTFSKVGDYISKNTKGIDAFDVINGFNTLKGYMGRNVKPPKRSLEDRQDIIAPAQGMNQFQKADSMANLQSQANIAQMNSKTIDPRLNTASMLGIQQNTNQGLNQLNTQDSQMYMQDQQRMMGQKQNENLRMLQNQQNFQVKIQDEAMRNYQMQQQASQQSINQGLNYFQQKQRDMQNQRLQKDANNQLMNANFYKQGIEEAQKNVKTTKNDDGTYGVTYRENGVVKSKNFKTATEASNFEMERLKSEEIQNEGREGGIKIRDGFKKFTENTQAMRRGGRIESGVEPNDRQKINNSINPFAYNNVYTNELMRNSKAVYLKNLSLRHQINNKSGR